MPGKVISKAERQKLLMKVVEDEIMSLDRAMENVTKSSNIMVQYYHQEIEHNALEYFRKGALPECLKKWVLMSRKFKDDMDILIMKLDRTIINIQGIRSMKNMAEGLKIGLEENRLISQCFTYYLKQLDDGYISKFNF